jgi:hypothetical protein
MSRPLTRLLRLLLLRLLRPLNLSSARRVLERNGYVSHSKKAWEAIHQTLSERERNLIIQRREIDRLRGELENEIGVVEGLRMDLTNARNSAVEWEREFHRLRGEKEELRRQLELRVEGAEKLADGLGKAFLRTSFFGHQKVEEFSQPEIKQGVNGYKTSSQRRAEMKRQIFETELAKVREKANEPKPDTAESESSDEL